MSLGHEHGLVLIGLAGPMDVVNPSLSLSLSGAKPKRKVMNHNSPKMALLLHGLAQHVGTGLDAHAGLNMSCLPVASSLYRKELNWVFLESQVA